MSLEIILTWESVFSTTAENSFVMSLVLYALVDIEKSKISGILAYFGDDRHHILNYTR